MIKKKGITLKTFAFTSVLITFVVMISFGLLYLVLPDYYFNVKNHNLNKNSDVLAKQLVDSASEEEMTQKIIEFSMENNADVAAYDTNNELIASFTSPVIFMNDNVKEGEVYSITTSSVDLESSDKEEPNSSNDDILIKLITDADYTDEFRFSPVFIQTSTSVEKNSLLQFNRTINNELIAHITISSTLQPIDEAKNVIISLMPYLLLFDILIALIAAYFFAKYLTKPIIHLSATAAEMQKLTPGILSGIRTNDEFGELSANLDLLYGNLCVNIESLKKEIDKVNALEKSKTYFMQAASHELKTPIAGLNGIVEGMIDSVGKYKDRDTYLRESKELINKLAALVSEILNTSRLDTTQISVEYEPVSMAELVDEALENYKLFIDEKNLILTCDQINIESKTDKSIMKKVLSNIISNAVRYTEEGKKINIAVCETESRRILYVENQCDNIQEDDLAKLFDPFYTRDYSRNKNKSGTGLGLYIVKRNLETLQIPYTLENTDLGLKFTMYFEKAMD